MEGVIVEVMKNWPFLGGHEGSLARHLIRLEGNVRILPPLFLVVLVSGAGEPLVRGLIQLLSRLTTSVGVLPQSLPSLEERTDPRPCEVLVRHQL